MKSVQGADSEREPPRRVEAKSRTRKRGRIVVISSGYASIAEPVIRHATDASSVAASGSVGVSCACAKTDRSGGRRAFAAAGPVRAGPSWGPGRLWGRDHEISRPLRPPS